MSAFDVRKLLAERGGEAFGLHERYLNPQMPKVLRTIGSTARADTRTFGARRCEMPARVVRSSRSDMFSPPST